MSAINDYSVTAPVGTLLRIKQEQAKYLMGCWRRAYSRESARRYAAQVKAISASIFYPDVCL